MTVPQDPALAEIVRRLVAAYQSDLPSLTDLIATKRFAARPKDLEDIRLLEILRLEEEA